MPALIATAFMLLICGFAPNIPNDFSQADQGLRDEA